MRLGTPRAPGEGVRLGTVRRPPHQASFSMGCYCEDENHCHRSVPRELLAERGAVVE